MSVLSNLAMACAEVTDPQVSGAAMLPVRLAIALTRALPVDAAAISVLDALRVPLGASSPDAEVAERLQITLGDGPCLAAFGLGYPVTGTQEQIARTWPIYFDLLVSQTPIRSVASLPLHTPRVRLGAIDLYWLSPDGVATLPMATALELADGVAEILLAAPQVLTLDAVIAPAWVMAAAAQRRMHVWQAVGMLNAGRSLSNRDAIDVLRAYATPTTPSWTTSPPIWSAGSYASRTSRPDVERTAIRFSPEHRPAVHAETTHSRRPRRSQTQC